MHLILLFASLAAAAEPTLLSDPVLSLPTRTPVAVEGLSFSTCALAPVIAPAPASGTVVFQVRLRRGNVSLVSVMSADPGTVSYQSCMERVLASYDWPVRRAELEVRVTVEEPATQELPAEQTQTAP